MANKKMKAVRMTTDAREGVHRGANGRIRPCCGFWLTLAQPALPAKLAERHGQGAADFCRRAGMAAYFVSEDPVWHQN